MDLTTTIQNITTLLPDDLTKVIDFIQAFFHLSIAKKDTNHRLIHKQLNQHVCPHCHSPHVNKNGHTKTGVQRYKCKDCTKTFTDTTNTILYGSKLTYETWLTCFECMIDKLSIRKTAKLIGISSTTVFLMRHKILKTFELLNKNQMLSGEIQMDEMYRTINLKGTKKHNMPRASKKRGTHSAPKRGISSHKVCIASAKDETDHMILKIVDNGSITSDMIRGAFEAHIQFKEARLITDCKSSYEAFAKENGLKLEQVKSGTYVNLNGYHLTEINGVYSNFEHFMKPFRGVSTKHLQGYLSWFQYQKLLNYTFTVLKEHPIAMMKYSIIQETLMRLSDLLLNLFLLI